VTSRAGDGTVATLRAHRFFRRTGSAEEAKANFLVNVDQGAVWLRAALAETPYVQTNMIRPKEISRRV